MRTVLSLLLACVLPGCGLALASGPGPVPARSRALRLPLRGPLAAADAEVSGLAWGPGADGRPVLLLLAEEPLRFPDGTRTPLAALPRAQVVEAVRMQRAGGTAAGLEPQPVGWRVPPTLSARLTSSDTSGLEAVAVAGLRLAVAHEQGGEGGDTLLLEGRLVVLDGRLTARFARARTLAPPPLPAAAAGDAAARHAVRHNKSYEALVATAHGWLALYECGGAVHVQGRGVAPVPMPRIPYRVTDATAPEADGRFWVLDYHFRGRECLPMDEDLARDQAAGGTPLGGEHIERLLALRLEGDRLVRTADAPVWIALEAEPRNWEGAVRLVDRAHGLDGFLVVTDRYPVEAGGTILAYVPRTPEAP